MNINGIISNSNILNNLKGTDSKSEDGAGSFLSMLKDKLNEVNDKQITAEETTEKFVKGEDVDVHEVMLATEEAKMSLELAVQIRNKIVEAYQELNRMQL